MSVPKRKARWLVRVFMLICMVCGMMGVDQVGAAEETVGSVSDTAKGADVPLVGRSWVRFFNGPAGLTDRPSGMAVDADGNVYVGGTSTTYENPTTLSDLVCVKYSTKGATRWKARYSVPGARLEGKGVALNQAGELFVLGERMLQNGLQRDYLTVKYDANGQELWVKKYRGPHPGHNYPKAIAVDDSGNVYVTGSSWQKGSTNDIVTVKYGPKGKRLWVSAYRAPAGISGDPVALKVDATGNVYVVGNLSWGGGGANADIVTVKYTADGKVRWAKRYDGPAKGPDSAAGIALDPDGNVCITGQSHGGASVYDFVTIKYAPGGKKLWSARFNGPANQADSPSAIAVDPSGNVYVTGQLVTPWAWANYATVKYSKGGKQRWAKYYDSPDMWTDAAWAMSVDVQGNVYVTGSCERIATREDIVTVKYSTTGQELWVKSYSGPNNGFDYPAAIGLDPAGNVYVTGYTMDPGTGKSDYVTMKYKQ
jgi:uncharacterized delta-60 repeat protein